MNVYGHIPLTPVVGFSIMAGAGPLFIDTKDGADIKGTLGGIQSFGVVVQNTHGPAGLKPDGTDVLHVNAEVLSVSSRSRMIMLVFHPFAKGISEHPVASM